MNDAPAPGRIVLTGLAVPYYPQSEEDEMSLPPFGRNTEPVMFTEAIIMEVCVL